METALPKQARDFDFGQISFDSDTMQVLSLSSKAAEFVFPLTQAPVNFSVLRRDGLLSYRWGVKVNKKGDAYVYCRDIKNAEKVSLHASGRQHIYMPKAPNGKDGFGSRFGNIWREPDFDSEAIASFSLVFPPWGVGTGPHFVKHSKDELLIIGHIEMVVVVAFFIVDAGKTMRGRMPHFVLGQLPMEPGRTLHVIAWREPQGNLIEMVRTALSQIPLATANGKAGAGEYTVRLQGFRRPNSAYMLTVPVRFAPPSD